MYSRNWIAWKTLKQRAKSNDDDDDKEARKKNCETFFCAKKQLFYPLRGYCNTHTHTYIYNYPINNIVFGFISSTRFSCLFFSTWLLFHWIFSIGFFFRHYIYRQQWESEKVFGCRRRCCRCNIKFRYSHVFSDQNIDTLRYLYLSWYNAIHSVDGRNEEKQILPCNYFDGRFFPFISAKEK